MKKIQRREKNLLCLLFACLKIFSLRFFLLIKPYKSRVQTFNYALFSMSGVLGCFPRCPLIWPAGLLLKQDMSYTPFQWQITCIIKLFWYWSFYFNAWNMIHNNFIRFSVSDFDAKMPRLVAVVFGVLGYFGMAKQSWTVLETQTAT
jgi:hypothetical protein